MHKQVNLNFTWILFSELFRNSHFKKNTGKARKHGTASVIAYALRIYALDLPLRNEIMA